MTEQLTLMKDIGMQVFFLSNICFWYWDTSNFSLKEWFGICFLLFNYLSVCIELILYSFKILVEFPSEAIQAWRILSQNNIFNYKFNLFNWHRTIQVFCFFLNVFFFPKYLLYFIKVAKYRGINVHISPFYLKYLQSL